MERLFRVSIWLNGTAHAIWQSKTAPKMPKFLKQNTQYMSYILATSFTKPCSTWHIYLPDQQYTKCDWKYRQIRTFPQVVPTRAIFERDSLGAHGVMTSDRRLTAVQKWMRMKNAPHNAIQMIPKMKTILSDVALILWMSSLSWHYVFLQLKTTEIPGFLRF